MGIKKIPIDDLRIGMYLAEVDISWLDTPFLKHSFVIDDTRQIVALKQAGAKIVGIDVEKSRLPQAAPVVTPSESPAPKAAIKPAPFQQEKSRAAEIRQAAKKALQQVHGAAQEGGGIEPAQISPIVDQTIDSLFRNNEAMLTLVHQRTTGLPLAEHAFAVMVLSLSMGQQLGLSDAELEHLGLAALLMDIGWLKLPAGLFAMQYSYTDIEYRTVQEHVAHGVRILEAARFAPEIVSLVESHHERHDGSGYPHLLAGDAIPLGARILSAADHFNSRLRGCYDSAPAIPATALRAVYAAMHRGSHDPAVAQILIKLIGVYPLSSAVVLNTGERGVVTRLNWKTPLLPRVTIYYNKSRQPLMKPYEINLAQQEGEASPRQIERIIDPHQPTEDPAGVLRFEED